MKKYLIYSTLDGKGNRYAEFRLPKSRRIIKITIGDGFTLIERKTNSILDTRQEEEDKAFAKQAIEYLRAIKS